MPAKEKHEKKEKALKNLLEASKAFVKEELPNLRPDEQEILGVTSVVAAIRHMHQRSDDLQEFDR